MGYQSWERTLRAVELVKDRLLRATTALETAAIVYAVIGGQRIGVGLIDESWPARLPDELASRSAPCSSRPMASRPRWRLGALDIEDLMLEHQTTRVHTNE